MVAEVEKQNNQRKQSRQTIVPKQPQSRTTEKREERGCGGKKFNEKMATRFRP